MTKNILYRQLSRLLLCPTLRSCTNTGITLPPSLTPSSFPTLPLHSTRHTHLSKIVPTCYPSNGHGLLLRRGDGYDDVVVPEQLLLVAEVMLLLLVHQGDLVVRKTFPLPPVLMRKLGRGHASPVSEVPRPASPPRAEQQGVHDGAGHELDDPGRGAVLGAGAARAGGFAGGGAAPVGGGRRHGEGVEVLGQVVVAVGQLGGRLVGVLGGGALVSVLRRRASEGGGQRRAGAVSELDGGRVLGEGLRASRAPSYRFWWERGNESEC